MKMNKDDIYKAIKAAQFIQEYCYTQEECDKCAFYIDSCTLYNNPMEWHDYFKEWIEKANKIN